MRDRRWLLAGVAVAGLLLAACGSSGGSSSSGSSSSGSTSAASTPSSAASSAPSGQAAMLKTEKTSMGTVLANAQGRTLYWFAIDTATASKCTGGCTSIWPPVAGSPQLSSGVSAPGKLGTIKRAGGSLQATYNGHPLYTFSGDSATGQVKGNGINSYGGVWHAVVLSGSGAGGSSPSSGSGGGY